MSVVKATRVQFCVELVFTMATTGVGRLVQLHAISMVTSIGSRKFDVIDRIAVATEVVIAGG